MEIIKNLVSVVVPTYNYGHFIAETISCILGQSYDYLECIVVDDGSTDNTSQILMDLSQDPRLKYHYKINGGLSSARNFGVTVAKGEFIAFLDSDDLISPKKIECNVNWFKINTHTQIVYNKAYYFEGSNIKKLYLNINLKNEGWMPEFDSRGLPLIRELVKRNIMPVNSAMIRRSALVNCGLFPEGLKAIEDWVFWFKAAVKGLWFSYQSEVSSYALVRVHQDSMSRRTKSQKSVEIEARALYGKLIKNIDEISDACVSELKSLNEQKLNDLEFRYFSAWKGTKKILKEKRSPKGKTTRIFKLIIKRFLNLP